MSRPSLGLIETKGLVGVIAAADAAAKAAAVVIATAELTPDAYMTIKIEGELSSVRAAVDAGARAAERVGELVAAHVIPRPDDDLGPMLPPLRYISDYHPDVDRPSLRPDGRPTRPESRAPSGGAPDTIAPDKTKRAPAQMRDQKPPRPAGPRPQPPGEKPPARAEAVPIPSVPLTEPTMDELEKVSVVKLRQYARTVAALAFQGRQISMANRNQLLEAIRSVREKK